MSTVTKAVIAVISVLALYIIGAILIATVHPFGIGYSAEVFDTGEVAAVSADGYVPQTVVVENHDSDWLFWWMFWNSGGGGCYSCNNYGYHYIGHGSYMGMNNTSYTTVNRSTVVNNHYTQAPPAPPTPAPKSAVANKPVAKPTVKPNVGAVQPNAKPTTKPEQPRAQATSKPEQPRATAKPNTTTKAPTAKPSTSKPSTAPKPAPKPPSSSAPKPQAPKPSAPKPSTSKPSAPRPRK